MAIAGVALFLFGLGVILIIVAPIGMKKNNRCSAQTPGTLTAIRERYDSNGRLPSLKVYSYEVNGVAYQLKSTALNPQADKVGDRCTIWYNPKKPQDALEYRHNSNKLFIILLIIGIASILSAIIMPFLILALQTQ